MRFRYYVTDLFEGSTRGTNDLKVANSFAECSDFFVVDADEGKWITEDGEGADIEEIHQSE